MLIEGIGTIALALWMIKQGMGPGESIMIVLGLPVLLFGVVLTIIGLAKSMKETAPDVSHLDLNPPPGKREQSGQGVPKQLCDNKDDKVVIWTGFLLAFLIATMILIQLAS